MDSRKTAQDDKLVMTQSLAPARIRATTRMDTICVRTRRKIELDRGIVRCWVADCDRALAPDPKRTPDPGPGVDWLNVLAVLGQARRCAARLAEFVRLRAPKVRLPVVYCVYLWAKNSVALVYPLYIPETCAHCDAGKQTITMAAIWPLIRRIESNGGAEAGAADTPAPK